MNHMLPHEILALLASAVVAVAVFRRLGLPPVIAYFLVGMVIGPSGTGWIASTEVTRFLAEFGIVFLLFSVGLEFSLPQLVAMRRLVLGLGGAQVLLTTAVAAGIAVLLGVPPQGALVMGGALAMSSTAIVVKQLTEQAEVTSEQGRAAIAVLLFQDLAVLPFLILIPVMAGGEEGTAIRELLWALVKGVSVVLIILWVGRWLLRPLFHEIARARSSELFTLSALLFALAAAGATQAAGLSMMLGAFVAGMLLGETEFRHQVEADIRPFRDVFLGLFFVTIGMLLDLHALPAILPAVLLLLVGLLVFKLLLVTALAWGMGMAAPVAFRTGLVLAQGGEFGLALLSLAFSVGLLEAVSSQVVLAAVILSMALTPLLIRHGGAITAWIFPQSYPGDWWTRIEEAREGARYLSGHVVICGYGRVGQSIGRFVEREGLDFAALDLDPVRVRNAREAGERVSFGDATHREILEAAGLDRARVIVVSFDDVLSALKIIEQVRTLNIDIPILVRTRDDSELERLQQAGATEVVPETLEASLMLASHLLLLLRVPVSRILRDIQAVRGDRYQMLREYFRGEEVEPLEEPGAFRERLETLALPPGAFAVGRTLGELRLQEAGVVVTAVRRGGIRGPHPTHEMLLQAGDVLVLYGTPEDLEHAEGLLFSGRLGGPH